MNGEIRLYEALGIRIIQKLVFRLERFRHRDDGDRNVNYHLLPRAEDSPERFIQYLFLNAGIHISGLVATLVLTGILIVMPGTLPAVWVVGIVGVIGNIYCIMLQRYNYLRIMMAMRKQEERIARQTAQWKERVSRHFLQADDPVMLRESARCLRRMRLDLARQGYTHICGSDEGVISWMAATAGAKPAAAGTGKMAGKTAGKTNSPGMLWRPEMVPWTAKDRKAQRVMRFLGRPVSDPPVSIFFAESGGVLADLRSFFETAPAAGTDALLQMTEQMLIGLENSALGSAPGSAGEYHEIAEEHGSIQELGYDRKGHPYNIFKETVLSVLRPGKKRKMKPDPAAQALLRSAFSEGWISAARLFALRNEENRELCDQLLLRLFMYGASDLTEELREPELKKHLESLTDEYLRECRSMITCARGTESAAAGMAEAENAAAETVEVKNASVRGNIRSRLKGKVTAAAREEDNRRMAVLNCMYLSRKARACGLQLNEHVLVR